MTFDPRGMGKLGSRLEKVGRSLKELERRGGEAKVRVKCQRGEK